MDARRQLVFTACGIFPRYTYAMDQSFPYYGLQFLDRGALALACEGQEYVLEGEWFWMQRPGVRYRFAPAPGHASWGHYFICFSGELAELWHCEGLIPVTPQQAPCVGVYGPRLAQIIALLSRTGAWAHLRAINALEAILLELAEARAPREEPARSFLLQVMDDIKSAGGARSEISLLTERYGISARTLRREFKQRSGVSMQTYLVQQRILRAIALLTGTDLPLKAIATQLGYTDVTQFSHQFRKYTSTTPKRYRNESMYQTTMPHAEAVAIAHNNLAADDIDSP